MKNPLLILMAAFLLQSCTGQVSLSTSTDDGDETPNAFTSAAISDVDLDTVIEYEEVIVSGISVQVAVDIDSGEYSVNGGEYIATRSAVANGDSIRVRHTSSSNYKSTVTSVLSVGTLGVSFISTTKEEEIIDDTEPDDFSFASADSVNLNSIILSDTVIISGISVAVPVSVSGGEYSINGGLFTNSTGTIDNNQRLQLRHTSSSSYGISELTTITVGDYSTSFQSTTAAADSSPDAFGFATQSPVDINSEMLSETITISGFNLDADLSITNGEYSLDGGASYSSADSTLSPNSSIQVRHTSSSEYETSMVTTLTIGGVQGYFESITGIAPDDTLPDSFSFASENDVNIGELILSDIVTISGIDVVVDVSVSGGDYSIDGGSFTSADGSISVGQSLQLRHISSSERGGTVSTTITVGDYSTVFQSSTVADSIDTTPDDFAFTTQTSVTVSSLIVSESIKITGLGAPALLSVSNGEYSTDAGASYSTADSTISTGASVQVRHPSSAEYGASTVTTLTIGGVEGYFESITEAEPGDTEPNSFSFADATDSSLQTSVESETVIISGISEPVSVTVENGEYRIDAGAYTDASGIIEDGQSLQLHHTSANDYSTTTTTTVTVGSLSVAFNSTTEAEPLDTEPDPFSFTDVSDTELGASIVSDPPITVSGIGTSVGISVSGGMYQINSAAYTDADGSVIAGDLVRVRHTSSINNNESTVTELTIGNLSSTFTSTTKAEAASDDTPDAISFPTHYDVALATAIESTIVTISGIDIPAAISIDYGEYRIDGGDYTSAPGSIGNNQSVQIRHTSASDSEGERTSILSVGSISASFTTIAQAADSDNEITPIDLGAKTDVALSTSYQSNQVSIAGIGEGISVSVSIVDGEYRTDMYSDDAWTSADGSLRLHDALQVRHTSADAYSSTQTTTITIEGDAFTFTTTTMAEPSDTVPNAFSFAPYSDVDLDLELVSDYAVVTGIDAPSSISVSNGNYQINEQTYYSAADGEVVNGDRVRVRHTSASDFDSVTTTVLTIGGVSAEFTSTTKLADTVPDSFSFTAETDVGIDEMIESNAIYVSGINSFSAISVVGGSYRLNNGSYTSADGLVELNDKVQLSHTSSSEYSATTTTTLTIGGVSAQFKSTTEPGDAISGSVIDGPLSGAIVFLDINNNGELDPGEPNTTTDENGAYQLEAPEGYFELYRVVAEITSDTIDTETGQVANPYSLVFYDPATQSAFEGFLSTDFVINPFTTMIQSEVEAGNAPLDAVELVGTHLGLNPQYHFYLLADYLAVKQSGEYPEGEQLDSADMDIINRLHNIARTAVRVLGIKMDEINLADPTLSARGKALASQQVLNALKIKLRDVIDTSDDVANDGDGSDAEQELDLNAELYAANIDADAILTNVASILDDADSLKPGRPVVIAPDYPLDSSALADIALTWNMYYGENGSSVYLLDVANASVIGDPVSLRADSPNSQSGEFDLNDLDSSAEAVYQLQVCLENASGTSCSQSFSLTVMHSEEFDSGVALTLPLAASGDPDLRPQAPKWDGWMQNVADGYVRTGDYYAPSWNKWSGALAETYEFFRCDEILGLDAAFENSRCDKLNSDDTAPEAISTWDRWLGGEVVGQAGGQTAKEIIAAAVCYNRNVSASAPCYYLEDGSDKGMQHLHQVRLCNNNYTDCSVSPVLKLKVVEGDGTYDVARSDDGSGTEADQNQTSEVNTTDPTVPPNKDADPTIGDNGGGSVTDTDEMAQSMDITAPSVQYVEGSWQPFLPGAELSIGMIKYWGQAGNLWEIWAEGPLTVDAGNAIVRDASLARQIANGEVSPMPAVSETWSDAASVSFADEGMYVIFGAFCNEGNTLADNPEACAKSSNTQTIEVSSSQSRTVVSTPTPDTGDDDGGDGGSSDSGDTGDATGFALLESEEYARLESERRGDKLNEAITNIRTVGVDQHEVIDGEDDGPDLNTYSFANVERVQAIFVERYAVLEARGLLYETASDDDNKARIAWEWLFPMANGHIKQFPSAYNEDVANGKYPYTYTNYLKAVAKYPAFCGDDAADSLADLDQLCMQAMASMFAHFAQEVGGHLGATNATYRAPVNDTLIDRSGDKETGNNDDGGPMKEFTCSGSESGGWCGDYAQTIPEWRQALYWVNESGCSETGAGCLYRSCDPGTWQAEAWPCPADTKYFGRGPKQLSYNYNYGPYSYIIYGDVNPLLQNPAKVTEGWLAFASAVYFFMQPRPPKPSMFELIYGYWTAPEVNSATDVDSKEPGPSFGASIMIINGGIECGGSKATAQAANRVKYYTGFMDYFGLDPEMGITYNKDGVQTHKTASMSCMNMLAFEPSHGAAYPSYWEEDWSALGQCQLVTYETAFSGYLDGDYEKCVHNLLK